MAEYMKHEIIGYPGGLGNIKFGLNTFNFDSNDEQYLYSEGCRPFTFNCLIKIYLIACLPEFNEDDNENLCEKQSLEEFRSLPKNNASINGFFDMMKSNKVYQCHKEVKYINSDNKLLRAFYMNNLATFLSESMNFANKIILAGAIFKVDRLLDTEQFMLECSLFQNDVKQGQLINCFNSSLAKVVSNTLTIDIIRYWSIWAIVTCTSAISDPSCAPICVATQRNKCDENGEKCINGYSKVLVDVFYTTEKLKSLNKVITKRLEKRCLYNNPCSNSKCGTQKCYTLSNGTSQCSSFSLLTVNAKTNVSLSDFRLQHGDIVKCLLKHNDENITKLHPIVKWVLKPFDSGILEEKTDSFVVSPKFEEFVNASCVVQFSKNSPKYKETKRIQLYAFPTTVDMIIMFGPNLYTNQHVYCRSNGVPEKDIFFLYRVHSNNFNPLHQISNSDVYLDIPFGAKLGFINISCQAYMVVAGVKQYTLPKFFVFNLYHMTDLKWGLENKIIYPVRFIACDVATLWPKSLVISQVDGPSQLTPYNKSGYLITNTLLGGLYSVLCSFSVNKSALFTYHRIYTFQLFKKPTFLCIHTKPGFKRITIICLHNGFPQDMALTSITMTKLIKNQGIISVNTVAMNKMTLFIENDLFDYELECNSTYETLSLRMTAMFKLINNDGVFIKKDDKNFPFCSSKGVQSEEMGNTDKFWFEFPKVMSFVEFRVCSTFIFLANFMAFCFFLLHMYALDKFVSTGLTVSSLSRRHCIMRFYKKLNEIALSRVKVAEVEDTALLRGKFEAYYISDE